MSGAMDQPAAADTMMNLWSGLHGRERDGGDAFRQGRSRFDVFLDLMPQMVWSTRPDGFHDYYNGRWYKFTGMPAGSTDGEAWNGMFHPDDQERAWERWRHSLATGELYEIEYRLRHRTGAYRWVLGRALPVRDPEGRIERWIGTCTDIHDAKTVAEQNAILSRELSHRIKNIFAVINGLIGLSARRHPEARDFADQLRERVDALGRAHELARPHSDESRPFVGDTTLHVTLRGLLDIYPAMSEGRVTITGDDVPLDDRGATPIALVFHELATNAVKYGGLATPDGRVDVTTTHADDLLTIEWHETGGPQVTAPEREGFGTRLIEMSIVQQLGGRIEREWRPGGMVARVVVAPGRLVR